MRWVKPLLFGILLAVVLFAATPTPVAAQQRAWAGVCVGGSDKDVATLQGLECLVANVFTVAITMIGLSGFVMFIYGSLKWMMSGSNSQGISGASKTMTYAVGGLVLALSAFIIINLLSSFTGVNLIRFFRIPTSSQQWGQPWLPMIVQP